MGVPPPRPPPPHHHHPRCRGIVALPQRSGTRGGGFPRAGRRPEGVSCRPAAAEGRAWRWRGGDNETRRPAGTVRPRAADCPPRTGLAASCVPPPPPPPPLVPSHGGKVGLVHGGLTPNGQYSWLRYLRLSSPGRPRGGGGPRDLDGKQTCAAGVPPPHVTRRPAVAAREAGMGKPLQSITSREITSNTDFIVIDSVLRTVFDSPRSRRRRRGRVFVAFFRGMKYLSSTAGAAVASVARPAGDPPLCLAPSACTGRWGCRQRPSPPRDRTRATIDCPPAATVHVASAIPRCPPSGAVPVCHSPPAATVDHQLFRPAPPPSCLLAPIRSALLPAFFFPLPPPPLRSPNPRLPLAC